MITLPQAKGKSYGICGMGKSGRSTVAALLASGATVYFWDDNAKTQEVGRKEFAKAKGMPIASWPWESLTALVMSPGIALDYPTVNPAVARAREHGIPVISDIALLGETQKDARYIGITGTNGKSTTTALIAHILQASGKPAEAGGNLGPPALTLKPLGKDGTYVLELSSYQLELMGKAKMNTAVLLNVSPDHLDHHGTMENYIEAKRRIFDGAKNAVIGIDEPVSEAICRDMIARKKACVVPISAKKKVANGVYVTNGVLCNSFALMEEKADIRGITSLQGEHNWQNAAAAYAACFLAGLKHGEIMAAMQTYPGLPHRMQYLGKAKDIVFINDSKATNADAAEQSLRTYDHIYWIAGGVAKEGGIDSLGHYFPKVRHAYLIGEAMQAFAATLKGKVDVTLSATLEKAFAQAVADAVKEDHAPVILLAPACASFDQFANFEVRGEVFTKLAQSWIKEHAA